jgi:O-antigen/teichoic acid export membrane protein
MNSVKRNLAWLVIAQAATWMISVAALLIVPRLIGDAAFGELSFAVVYMSFFELLATLGTNTFLVKAIARDPSNVGRFLVNTVAMRLVMTAVLVVVALGLGSALGFPPTTMWLIAAGSIGLILTGVGGAIGASLTGLQMMSGIAKWNVIQSYIGGVLSLVVLITHGSLITYAFVFNIAFIVSIPPNLHRLWPYMHGDKRVDIRFWPQILKGGFPFFILAALLVVYGTIDIPLLQAMTGSDQVGWYAVAYRWVGLPAFFAATVAAAFFPALSAEGVEVTPAFVSLANRALRVAVIVATPAAIGIALIAEPFLTLIYRGQFQEAIPLLRILAIHIPIVSLDIILGSVAVAADRQRQWVMVSVAATLFNPLLNLVAIPQTQRVFGNGAIGAAIVTVLTEVLLMCGALALRPPGVLDGSTLRALLRIAVASLTMVPVVIALSSAPLAAQVFAGVVCYAVASLALKTISIDEIKRWSVGALRRQPRPALTVGPLPFEDVTP